MSTSIILADDHTILRQGLRALLDAEPGFRVVGEARNGLQALQLTDELRPDVLVLDMVMDGLQGLEITRQVKKRHPHTQVVILSMYRNEAYVLKALKNGASAYVLKGSDARELIKAIQSVMAGQRYLSPPLDEHAIEALSQQISTDDLDPYTALSGREREVFHMAAHGLSNPEIAESLGISVRTVEGHRARLMRKLGLNNQTELVRYAMKKGLLPPDD
jgi:DNA-binding NarL/FixJ family response regulator